MDVIKCRKRGRGSPTHPIEKTSLLFNYKFILLKVFKILFVLCLPFIFWSPSQLFKNVTTYLVSRGTQFGSPLLCFHSLFTLPTGEPFAVISFVICVIQWGDPLQWLPWLFTLPNWDTLFSYFLAINVNRWGYPLQ